MSISVIDSNMFQLLNASVTDLLGWIQTGGGLTSALNSNITVLNLGLSTIPAIDLLREYVNTSVAWAFLDIKFGPRGWPHRLSTIIRKQFVLKSKVKAQPLNHPSGFHFPDWLSIVLNPKTFGIISATPLRKPVQRLGREQLLSCAPHAIFSSSAVINGGAAAELRL